MKKIYFLLRILVSIILLYTLRFKLLAHPDSVFIFSKIGIEPYGRLFVGIIELIASFLIVAPRTIWIGALMSLVMMTSLLFVHLTILGVEVRNDHGLSFYFALIAWISSTLVLWNERKNIPFIN